MLRGFKVARHAPMVTYFFFVDDSLLFIRAKCSDYDDLLRILHVYELALGQTINLDKSGIWISTNASIDEKDMVRNVLGIRRGLNMKTTFWLAFLY